MKTRTILLSLLSMLTAPLALSAQESLSIDLQTAVSNALQYNKQLQASAVDRDIYYQKVREARAAGLPQINATLSTDTYFGKKLSFGAGEMDITSTKLQATANWTFSMQQIAGVKLAKIVQNLTDCSIAQTELGVKANVTDTYYAILVYERNLEILRDNLADMETIAKHTAYSFEAGAAERTDVDQMNVNVATLKNSIFSLERSLESTKRLLVLQMGVPISTKITTTQKLDDLIGDGATNPDNEKLNIENNVDYKQLKLSREVGEQTVKVRKYAYIPTLTGTYQFTHNLRGGGFMNFKNTAMLTLNIPVFSGFQRHSQLKQAKLDVQKTDINLALLEDNLQQNLEQYSFELQTAIDAYNLQKENLEVAKRVLANYKNKYDQGAFSSLALTQANSNYLQAESSYASASLDLLMAHTKLQKLCNSFNY
ncbi:MAG: TolC family protein [Bacteroidales bacterium]|nr:TolC family protein [Bacteroidales bacterium]